MVKRKVTQKELENTIKQHSLWLKSSRKRGQKADLSHLDISNLDVPLNSFLGINFSNSDATNSNFQRSSLREITANNTNFSFANFSRSGVMHAKITNCNLFNANIQDCSLDFTDFSNSDLRGANLQKCLFIRSNLSNIKIDGRTAFDNSILYNVIIDKETREKIEKLNIGASFIYEGLFKIIRRIEFPLRYQRAGISLLNYCANVISNKYSNKAVRIKLEQDGLRVKFSVESDQSEIIEKTKILLRKYGELVRNNVTALEFYKNDIEEKDYRIMELKNKFEFVKMELSLLKSNDKNRFKQFLECFNFNFRKKTDVKKNNTK